MTAVCVLIFRGAYSGNRKSIKLTWILDYKLYCRYSCCCYCSCYFYLLGKGRYVFVVIVCLFVCKQHYQKSYETDCNEMLWRDPGYNELWMKFGGNLVLLRCKNEQKNS